MTLESARKSDGVLQSSLRYCRLIDWAKNAVEFGLRRARPDGQDRLDCVLQDSLCSRPCGAIEPRRPTGPKEHQIGINLLGFADNDVRWRAHGNGGFVDHHLVER